MLRSVTLPNIEEQWIPHLELIAKKLTEQYSNGGSFYVLYSHDPNARIDIWLRRRNRLYFLAGAGTVIAAMLLWQHKENIKELMKKQWKK